MMKYGLILAILLVCCGCIKPTPQKLSDIKRVGIAGSHDIVYTIVTIEGKEWLATKGAYGFWYLSGPLNVLTLEEPKNE